MTEQIISTQRFIWKYRLEIRDYQEVALPFGHKILHVGNQFDDVYMWVAVKFDTEPYSIINRRIYIFGTGNPLPDNFIDLDYLGTAITDAGNYVWHVFDGGIIQKSLRSSNVETI